MATTPPNLLAGTAYVTVDGKSFAITGEGSYAPSGDSRETLKGQSGVHGVKSMPMPGFISWNGRDASSVSIQALQSATDATVVLQSATGKTIIARNAWRVGEGPIEVNTEEGTFPVRFESADVTEN